MSDIATLMQKDPLEMTGRDIEELVSYFRQARKQFNLGNAKAGSTKPKTEKQKALASLAESIKVSL